MTDDLGVAEPDSPFTPVWIGTAAGFLVGLIALVLAVSSGGPGHGDYVAARALFPIPMLFTLYQGNTIGSISIVFAVIQFPAYGAIIGWNFGQRSYRVTLGAVFIHLLSAVACFAGLLPNFS